MRLKKLCCSGEGDADHRGPAVAADYKHPAEGGLLWGESTYKVKTSPISDPCRVYSNSHTSQCFVFDLIKWHQTNDMTLNLCVFTRDVNPPPAMTWGQRISSLRKTAWSASSSTGSEYFGVWSHIWTKFWQKCVVRKDFSLSFFMLSVGILETHAGRLQNFNSLFWLCENLKM